MIKLVARTLSVAIAVFSFCCFAYPQTPRRILAGFIESREVSSRLANLGEPPRDVVLAKSALVMFDATMARSQCEGKASAVSKPDFDNAFFEAEPTSFSDRLPAIPVPNLSNDSAAKFQSGDAGPQVQLNPFFD